MNDLIIFFLIATLGYLMGSIKIKGIELGTAGVLLMSLVFGHFGYIIPTIIRNLGLICFVTSVGFIAGPKFFRNFKKNAASYVLLGIIIILISGISCAVILFLTNIEPALCVGIMTGALTSTPGLAAAIEAAGAKGPLASIGYGIAYPFGVVSVVLFVQLIPKILKVNIKEEHKKFAEENTVIEERTYKKLHAIDHGGGFFAFCLAILFGLLLARFNIALPGGAVFSLGLSGAPLIMGLIFGHFGSIGKISLSVETTVLKTFREFGLILFLVGAGTDAGQGFIEILQEYGIVLFIYGGIMSVLPMAVGYLFADKILHLNLFNNLGSITGGMTSTPALATLIEVTGTDDVASAYAATYPIALVCVILFSQFIIILM